MSRIFVLAASKTELDPLARLLGVSRWDSPSHAGPISAGPNQLEFFITGLGPNRAKASATDILLYGSEPQSAGHPQHLKPEAAIVIGLCGGLTDSLPETAIAVYSNCLSAMNGGGSYPTSPELSARVTALLNTQNVPCSSVIGITSPRIAITKDDKLGLARTGAQVVDMESYAVLSVSRQAGVPATVVRVVSDSLDRKLPDLNPALNADGSIKKGKALLIMLGSPVLTARAISANNRAARHLAKSLKVVLSADFPCLR
jgi:Phosphorylase superfamily